MNKGSSPILTLNSESKYDEANEYNLHLIYLAIIKKFS